MKRLTKVEEEVMQVIWNVQKGFVKDFIAQLPVPRPPYSTISSVVRILEKKGFVDHRSYGKTHEYFPVISHDEYRSHLFRGIFKNYFHGSRQNLLSFFAKEEEISLSELQEIIDDLSKEQDNE